MPSVPNFVNVESGPRKAAASSGKLAPLFAAVLGLMLLYGAGFAQTEEIHNGAHDTRHSAGFPCH
ncbi:MAG: CbtB domain-containing protein [Casimicrobiaceae bacterium]